MNKKSIIILIFFTLIILIGTGYDYLINSTLYKYGLQFNMGWWHTDQVLNLCFYEIVIIILLYFYCDIRFLFLSEAFVLSSGQDIIYFFVWNKLVFPSGDWWWMSNYTLFGTWRTWVQIIWTCLWIFFCSYYLLFFTKRKSHGPRNEICVASIMDAHGWILIVPLSICA
jgi:hypothetical protein